MKTKGIHMIWSTYGSWLPGDPRGHWSALMDIRGRYPGDRQVLQRGDPGTHQRAKDLLKGKEVILTTREQDIIVNTIRDVPGEHSIHAIAVERTHVQLFIAPTRIPLVTLIVDSKEERPVRVLQTRPNVVVRRTWVRGFWTKIIECDRGMDAVQRYILRNNLRRGLTASPWEFVSHGLR